MRVNFTLDKKQAIVNEYLSDKMLTCGLLAKRNKVSSGYIRNILVQSGIKLRNSGPRKYLVNEKYFNVIDSEDKAYFLGLMYSDGYVSKDTNVIKISLQECDLHILEEFKTKIGYTGKIHFIKSKNDRWKNTYTLSICNESIINDLKRLGCCSQKSLILDFPDFNKIPKRLMRHFIRGYIDGDGSIDPKKKALRITSSSKFISKIKTYLKKEIGTNGIICHKKTDNILTDSIFFSQRLGSEKILDWVYKDSSVYLHRKYNSYLEIKKKTSDQKNIRYRAISPNNKEFSIEKKVGSIKTFCESNGLPRLFFKRLPIEKWKIRKGWRIKRLNVNYR